MASFIDVEFFPAEKVLFENRLPVLTPVFAEACAIFS